MRIKVCLIVSLMLALVFFSGTAAAQEQQLGITLPNGQIIPMDGLDDTEKQYLTKYMSKVAEAQTAKAKDSAKVSDAMTDAFLNDPEKLDAWRGLITGTIKDVANDMNIAVNDFIATPVGVGIAALIVYKVMGRDMLGKVYDVVLIIPFWFTAMLVLFYLQRKFLSYETIYNAEKTTGYDSKGRPIVERSGPEKVLKYPWKSNDARSLATTVMVVAGMVVTLVTLVVLF